MQAVGDAATLVQRDAARRFRSWSTTVLGFLGFLCAIFTLLWVITSFFVAFLAMALIAYAFTAVVVARSYRPARRSLAELEELTGALRGRILEGRALDPPNEIPKGAVVLVLDSGLVVHRGGSKLRVLRMYGRDGSPIRPTLREAIVWATLRRSDGGGPAKTSTGRAYLPSSDFERIAAKWSPAKSELSRLELAEAGSMEAERVRSRVVGEPRGCAVFEVEGGHVPATDVAAEADAIQRMLDRFWGSPVGEGAAPSGYT